MTMDSDLREAIEYALEGIEVGRGTLVDSVSVSPMEISIYLTDGRFFRLAIAYSIKDTEDEQ